MVIAPKKNKKTSSHYFLLTLPRALYYYLSKSKISAATKGLWPAQGSTSCGKPHLTTSCYRHSVFKWDLGTFLAQHPFLGGWGRYPFNLGVLVILHPLLPLKGSTCYSTSMSHTQKLLPCLGKVTFKSNCKPLQGTDHVIAVRAGIFQEFTVSQALRYGSPSYVPFPSVITTSWPYEDSQMIIYVFFFVFFFLSFCLF